MAETHDTAAAAAATEESFPPSSLRTAQVFRVRDPSTLHIHQRNLASVMPLWPAPDTGTVHARFNPMWFSNDDWVWAMQQAWRILSEDVDAARFVPEELMYILRFPRLVIQVTQDYDFLSAVWDAVTCFSPRVACMLQEMETRRLHPPFSGVEEEEAASPSQSIEGEEGGESWTGGVLATPPLPLPSPSSPETAGTQDLSITTPSTSPTPPASPHEERQEEEELEQRTEEIGTPPSSPSSQEKDEEGKHEERQMREEEEEEGGKEATAASPSSSPPPAAASGAGEGEEEDGSGQYGITNREVILVPQTSTPLATPVYMHFVPELPDGAPYPAGEYSDLGFLAPTKMMVTDEEGSGKDEIAVFVEPAVVNLSMFWRSKSKNEAYIAGGRMARLGTALLSPIAANVGGYINYPEMWTLERVGGKPENEEKMDIMRFALIHFAEAARKRASAAYETARRALSDEEAASYPPTLDTYLEKPGRDEKRPIDLAKFLLLNNLRYARGTKQRAEILSDTSSPLLVALWAAMVLQQVDDRTEEPLPAPDIDAFRVYIDSRGEFVPLSSTSVSDDTQRIILQYMILNLFMLAQFIPVDRVSTVFLQFGSGQLRTADKFFKTKILNL